VRDRGSLLARGYGGGNPGQHRSAGGYLDQPGAIHRQSNTLLAVDGIDRLRRVKWYMAYAQVDAGEPSTQSTPQVFELIPYVAGGAAATGASSRCWHSDTC